jgi:acyl-CoA thioester hydrolase
VRFEDVVEIAVQAARVGRKSVTYTFEFTHHGEVVARGQISTVCCRVRPGAHALESIEVPEGIRARLS